MRRAADSALMLCFWLCCDARSCLWCALRRRRPVRGTSSVITCPGNADPIIPRTTQPQLHSDSAVTHMQSDAQPAQHMGRTTARKG